MQSGPVERCGGIAGWRSRPRVGPNRLCSEKRELCYSIMLLKTCHYAPIMLPLCHIQIHIQNGIHIQIYIQIVPRWTRRWSSRRGGLGRGRGIQIHINFHYATYKSTYKMESTCKFTYISEPMSHRAQYMHSNTTVLIFSTDTCTELQLYRYSICIRTQQY